MSSEQLHTTALDYASIEDSALKRRMEFISVKDFEAYEPVDLRELFPADEAEDQLEEVALSALQFILDLREEKLADAEPFENMDKVSSFMGKLAMQPFGKLSYVNRLEVPDKAGGEVKPYRHPGVTYDMFRQAFVIDENVSRFRSNAYVDKPWLPVISKELFVESIAVHESVHLAGIPDIAYVQVYPASEGPRLLKGLNVARSVLQSKEGGKIAGKFLEEGFATLSGHQYIWSRVPEVGADRRVVKAHSTQGVELALPVRQAFAAASYVCAAWAVERLIDCSPALGDVLTASRAYGAVPHEIRGAVEREIDRVDSRLYDVLDVADPHDMDSSMAAAALTDMIVKNVSGR